MAQTYIHTYGHGNSMTNSAQCGQVGENGGVGAKWNQNVGRRSVVTTLGTFEAISPLSLCRVDSLQAPIEDKGGE